MGNVFVCCAPPLTAQNGGGGDENDANFIKAARTKSPVTSSFSVFTPVHFRATPKVEKLNSTKHTSGNNLTVFSFTPLKKSWIDPLSPKAANNKPTPVVWQSDGSLLTHGKMYEQLLEHVEDEEDEVNDNNAEVVNNLDNLNRLSNEDMRDVSETALGSTPNLPNRRQSNNNNSPNKEGLQSRMSKMFRRSSVQRASGGFANKMDDSVPHSSGPRHRRQFSSGAYDLKSDNMFSSLQPPFSSMRDSDVKMKKEQSDPPPMSVKINSASSNSSGSRRHKRNGSDPTFLGRIRSSTLSIRRGSFILTAKDEHSDTGVNPAVINSLPPSPWVAKKSIIKSKHVVDFLATLEMKDEGLTEASLEMFLRMRRERAQATREPNLEKQEEMEEAGWTLQDLEEFLFSPLNDVVDESALARDDDLTKPLSHYFISSSHNTYLSGGQYAVTGGRADVTMYSKAIANNCRCVEIDVYDGPEGDPIVMHGNATIGGGFLTFLEVVAHIASSAFKKGQHEQLLIINLENNLKTQTKRASEILIGAFGTRIVRVDDEKFGFVKMKQRGWLPSPLELQGRVLIRSKPKVSDIAFKRLIYLRNHKFSPVDAVYKEFYHSSSFPDNRVAKAFKALTQKTPVELHSKYVNRVFPRSLAVKSENFDPIKMWLMGIQLVALNFQTGGLEMDIYRCMFSRNGGKGLVLKPYLFRKEFDTSTLMKKPPTVLQTNKFDRIRKNTVDKIPRFRRRSISNDNIENSLLLPPAAKMGGQNFEPFGQNYKPSVNSEDKWTEEEDNKSQSSSEEEESDMELDEFLRTTSNQSMNQSSSLIAIRELSSGEKAPLVSPIDQSILSTTARRRDRRKSTGSVSNYSSLLSSSPPPSNSSVDDSGIASGGSFNARAGKLETVKEDSRKIFINSVSISVVALRTSAKRPAVTREVSSKNWFTRGNSTRLSNEVDSDAEKQPASALPSQPEDEEMSTNVDLVKSNVDELDSYFLEVEVDGFDKSDKKTKVRSSKPFNSSRASLEGLKSIGCILNDSESAVITLKLISSLNESTVCSRSFYAHCLQDGVQEVMLVSPSRQSNGSAPMFLVANYELTYVLRDANSTTIELFKAEQIPPSLFCPSKVSLLHITIMYARMETKHELSKFDPFVTVEVAGMANDCRELRSPRASRCEVLGISEEMKSKYACWMFPLKITITSSEFAFLQVGLRSYIGDASSSWVEEGVSLPTNAQSRRRISATANPNAMRKEEGNSLQTIGKTCLWVNALRPGYRSVRLMNTNEAGTGQVHVATLLCHFKLYDARTETFTKPE